VAPWATGRLSSPLNSRQLSSVVWQATAPSLPDMAGSDSWHRFLGIARVDNAPSRQPFGTSERHQPVGNVSAALSRERRAGRGCQDELDGLGRNS